MTERWRPVSQIVVLALVGCGSDRVAAPVGSAGTEIILSAPVPRSALPGSADSSGSVVFVSAHPNAAPGAILAIVRGADGQSVTASMRDGGFDPVAIVAADGDLVTVIMDDGSGTTTSEELMVQPRQPSRVVRTSPSPQQTDVPLNVVIRVVFSAPVDLESARTGISLTTGAGTVIPGVVVAAGAVVVDYVVTAGSLAPQTTYRLGVTREVRDILGRALAEPMTVDFRTGSGNQSAPVGEGTLTLEVTPASIDVVPGGSQHPEVTITRGGTFTGAVQLGSADPEGVSVSFGSSTIDMVAGRTTAAVSAHPEISPGTRTIVIHGNRVGPRALPATATVTVNVVTPSGAVSLVPDPTPLAVAAGGPAVTSVISVNRHGAFEGPVELMVMAYPYMSNPGRGFPAGVAAVLSPTTATGANSTLSISADPGAANGTYLLIIRGAGAGVADAYATAWYTVTGGAPAPALALDPAAVVVTAGGPGVSSELACTACTAPGYLSLTLSTGGVPAGVTTDLARSMSMSTTTTLTVQAGAATAPGTYFVSVTAVSRISPDAAPPPLHALLRVEVLAAPR